MLLLYPLGRKCPYIYLKSYPTYFVKARCVFVCFVCSSRLVSGVLNHELCEVVGRLCMEIHMPVAGEGALLFIIFTKESLTPKGLVLYTSSSYKPGIGTLFSVKGQSKYFQLHRPVSAPTTQVCRCSSKAVCQPLWISIKWKKCKYHPPPLTYGSFLFPPTHQDSPDHHTEVSVEIRGHILYNQHI